MNKYITEFIGTFFLVLVIGLTAPLGTIGASEWSLAPLAIGSILMVMVYMGGPISGAHYNPAVTLAIFIRGKINIKDAGIYWGVQFLAAVASAALVALMVKGRYDEAAFIVAPPQADLMINSILVEIFFTFALALVVLNVATVPSTQPNSYYGLAIGFTVMVGAFSGGGISGGAFNPAVGIGPNLVAAEFNNMLMYLFAPLVGGALAAFVFRVQYPKLNA